MSNRSVFRTASIALGTIASCLLFAAIPLGQTTAPPPAGQASPASPASPAGPASLASPPKLASPAHPKAAGAFAVPALIVPAGTIIPLELKNTVNSRTAYEGQAIYCVTLFPIAVADRMLIPAGSYVQGEVTQVTRPGKVTGKAQLSLRFDKVVLPTGVARPLSASLSSIGGSRLEDAKKDKEGDDATGDKAGQNLAAQGAADAVVDASGLGGGDPLMAATEGVGGLMVMLATRGKTIVLRPGTTMEITLREALDLGKKRGASDSRQPPPLRHRPPSQ